MGLQLPVTADVGAKPAGGPQNLPAVAGLDRYRLLVRIDSNDGLVHPGHLLAHKQPDGEGGHRYFELGRPFLSHTPPRHPARTQAMKEPTPAPAGKQPQEESLPGHLTRTCADPAVWKDISSRSAAALITPW
jgi:hypothetical protein